MLADGEWTPLGGAAIFSLDGDKITSDVARTKPRPLAQTYASLEPDERWRAVIGRQERSLIGRRTDSIRYARAVCIALTAALAVTACGDGNADARGSGDDRRYVNFPVRNNDMAPKFPLIEESVLAFDPRAYQESTPELGDIVLFRMPRRGGEQWCASPPRAGRACSRARPTGPRRAVLRVVAGPGQRIAFREGRAVVDGRRERRRRLLTESDCELCTLPRPVRVPRDRLFLAGDNRSDATDSRTFGPVPVEAVIGKYAGYVTD